MADDIAIGNSVGGGGTDLSRYFTHSSDQHGALANPTLAQLVAAIESNPVFAMSLGSKELFHSNLLAWFIRHHPEVGTALLNEWASASAPGPTRVSREWKNMDLVLQSDEHMVVIENKTFALPDENQLDRYASKLANTKHTALALVLLSLTAPAWPENTYTTSAGLVWVRRSYRDLAVLLRAAQPWIARRDAYAAATLQHWIALLDNLNTLVAILGRLDPGELLMLPKEQRALLKSSHLDAPVQKMRCQAVVALLRTQRVSATANLTRGEGLVEWFTPGPGLQLGWQLQHGQFRLAAIVPPGHPGYGRDDKARLARQTAARDYLSFFRFDAIPTADASQPPDDGWSRYDPNFVYRHVPASAMTVGQVVAAGAEYAHRAELTLSANKGHVLAAM